MNCVNCSKKSCKSSNYTIELGMDGDICCICLSNYHVGQSVTIISCCGHIYHKHCIERWFEVKETCPTCSVDNN